MPPAPAGRQPSPAPGRRQLVTSLAIAISPTTTITPRSTLNAHPSLPPAPWRAADAGGTSAQAWWRTERQTFIPVPEAGLAVFTIRVDVEPLAQAIDSAAKARRLHDALASMSPAVLRYRGLQAVRDPLLHWLASRAAP